MKKSVLSVSAIALLAIACNQTNTAGNTTDSNTTTQSIAEQREIITEDISYIGTYEGVLPCADCGGIKTTLTVEKSSYTLEEEYQGKGTFSSKGTASYDETKHLLTLTNSDDAKDIRYYQVIENNLVMLNADGSTISDTTLANQYILHKK